jgi:hypothetical protein
VSRIFTSIGLQRHRVRTVLTCFLLHCPIMDSSSVLSDEDYDLISNPGQRSLESSITDLHHIPALNAECT